MDTRKLLTILFSVLLISFISCKMQQSESDGSQQLSISTDPTAAMDTSNMEMIDGVPVIPTPGSQINKDKVVEVLEEGNTSFREISEAREEAEVKRNIENLDQLLQNDRVRSDEELQFMVHNILGSFYLKMYEYSDQGSDLDQAEKHLNSAISLFEDQAEYKADLADAFTGRIAVHSLREEYDKVVSNMQYLIEEFQNIGYGFYENWFASRQVEALYNLIEKESFDDVKSQEILDILTKVADKYDNEVGITAQMALARHFAGENQQDKADEFAEAIEQRMASLNNPEFKEDKWERFKIRLSSIEHRERQMADLSERDTLFYKIQPEMIDEASITIDEQQSSYRLSVQLKKDYHSEYGQLTAENIGNFLAVVHNGEVISPSLPTIQTGISGGRFSIGPFDRKEEAQSIHQRILNE